MPWSLHAGAPQMASLLQHSMWEEAGVKWDLEFPNLQSLSRARICSRISWPLCGELRAAEVESLAGLSLQLAALLQPLPLVLQPQQPPAFILASHSFSSLASWCLSISRFFPTGVQKKRCLFNTFGRANTLRSFVVRWPAKTCDQTRTGVSKLRPIKLNLVIFDKVLPEQTILICLLLFMTAYTLQQQS
jgi:hypothetical protein